MSVAKTIICVLTVSLCTSLPARAPAAPVPEIKYVYVSDTDRWVYYTVGSLSRVGQFDATGKFHVEWERDFTQQGSGVFSQRPAVSVMVRGRCYQFDDGKLIPGEFKENDGFVADPKGAAIRFQDYKPGPDAVPIWNLPGYFMPKSKFDERKKWLADHAGTDPQLLAEKAKLDVAAERSK
jgi:hypothetical protein